MPSVLELLEGRSILLTGATGFVGKVLLEKLLRCAPGVRSVYVLVRPSKGCSAMQRVSNEIIASPVFSRLRSEIGDDDFHMRVSKKIIPASGDLAQQNLGLAEDLLHDIQANVHFIIHGAASVDFNLRLDLAVEQNVYGTMRVLDVADACHQLIAFVHISTAYTNCTQPSGVIVSERLYPCPFDIQAMLSTISRLSSRELQKVTVDGLIGDWPNSYTFTKFITEHLIHQRCFGRSSYSVSILRPTMIGAAWLEPVPGWVDVISAAGAIYVAGALGVLKILPGNPDHIGDIVPVDFVVNAVILSMPAAVHHPNKFFICQAAASVYKPWRWRNAIETLPPFFRTHMSEHAINQNISFKMISNQTLYELEFFARYGIPAAVLNALALIGTKSQKRNAEQFQRLVMKMSFIVNAFRYFTENEWRFENKNLLSVIQGQPATEAKWFWLDLTQLDYSQYHKVFAYGLLKFVLKEDLIEVGDPRLSRQVSLHEFDSNPANTSSLRQLFPNLSWALSNLKNQHSVSGPSISQMKAAVINSPRVQAALTALTEREPDVSPAQASAHASHLLDVMVGETRPVVLITMASVLRKLFGRLYEDIFINLPGVDRVCNLAKDGTPIIYIPTHRSYMDFLLVSYLCFIYRLPIPYIAAGDDFLELAVVRWIFRHSGAFFIRRTFHGDDLYKTLFNEYVRQLLCLGKSLEFFIEGSRSRSGKMIHPKLGILRTVTNTVLRGDIQDAYIVPIAINYEKTLEGSSYSRELQGSSKMKETLRNLLSSSSSVLSSKFGRISIHVGDPISIRAQLDPSQDLSMITRSMAFRVSWELQNAGEIMATHILATLLLMYRRGISASQLALKFEWLRREILLRNGRLCFFESEKHEWLVRRSVDLLRDLIEERHHDVFEPKISQRPDYPNMLLLGHYRNKIVHVFFKEGIWACAFHSIGLDSTEGVDCGLLFTSANFLFSLMKREVLFSPDSSAEDFQSSFQLMLSRGVFRQLSNGRIEIASEAMFSFLCSLCWPFIDSYYVAGLLLHTLEGNHEEHQVILRTQWLATTLYHESMICFYESCSGDTLRNALAAFHEQFGIIERSRKPLLPEKKSKKKPLEFVQAPRYRTEISINPKFQDGVELQHLIHRIDLLRKRPPVVRTSMRRAMIAEIPLLAKL